MKILALDSVSEEGLAVLKEANGYQVDSQGKMTEEELIGAIPEYDALIVRSGTKVTKKALEYAQRLKIIARAGVGVDNIDVPAATEKGIVVVNAPDGNTIAAAEHTVGLMLALARNIPQAVNTLKNGKWDKKKYTGVELREKLLGVIGLGKIGSQVAKRARALEMSVLAYDPFASQEQARALGVELADLETVLKEADFLTFHLPLNNNTRHLIGEKEFGLMKTGVRVLNVARGGILDEQALYEAVVSGKVKGAAIDVFENEPVTDSPLFALENVVVTPHLGAATAEAQTKVAVEVAHDVLRALGGEPVKNPVNAPKN